MAISDYTALIQNLAGDSDGKLSPADLDGALRLAVLRYSQDRPRSVVADLTLAEAGNFLALPAGWQDEFSEVRSVEYPIGQMPASLLRPGDDWAIYVTPSEIGLVFVTSLRAGEMVRVNYTLRHILDSDTDTIPEHHREAVACWAASAACEQLASLYAANSLPTIQADRVDQTSPQRAYTQRAMALRKRYQDEIGVEEKRNAAAGTVVSPVRRNSLGGQRLTHPIPGWTGQR